MANLIHLPDRIDLLAPVRRWLNCLEIHDVNLAKLLCQILPARCPFERNIKLWGGAIAHIPPLCQLNPLYDEIVYLRFRALSYLADECGLDITAYF
jgi:Mo-dependent nitrogenase C-terminus